MPVTDQQVAVFRALMGGDGDTYARLLAGLDRETDKIGFAALLGCCFYEAVDRRFGANGATPDAAEVIEFVGEVRARSAEIADELDPRVAERVILLESDDPLDDVDGGTYGHTQMLILAALAADAQLDDAGLEEFMTVVCAMADDWVDQYPYKDADDRS